MLSDFILHYRSDTIRSKRVGGNWWFSFDDILSISTLVEAKDFQSKQYAMSLVHPANKGFISYDVISPEGVVALLTTPLFTGADKFGLTEWLKDPLMVSQRYAKKIPGEDLHPAITGYSLTALAALVGVSRHKIEQRLIDSGAADLMGCPVEPYKAPSRFSHGRAVRQWNKEVFKLLDLR